MAEGGNNDFIEHDSDGPEDRTARKMFTVLVCHLDSKVKLPDDQLYSCVPTGDDPVEFIRRHPKYFMLFEDDSGAPCLVAAKLNNFSLCLAYGKRNSACHRLDCRLLHLCRDHVSGFCEMGMACQREHHFQTRHNKAVLASLGLLQFQDENLLSLLRVSSPQVCRNFNKKMVCLNEDKCTRFHICDQYVIGKCEATEAGDNLPCFKSHDFASPHSKRLLRLYNLHNHSKNDAVNALLLHKVKRTPRNLPNPVTPQRVPRRINRGLQLDEDTSDVELPVPLSEAISDVVQDADSLFLLQSALDFDEAELMKLICYQTEVEHQGKLDDLSSRTEIIRVLPKPQRLAQPVTRLKKTPLDQRLHNSPVRAATSDNENQPTANHGPLYTGYAPQDDKKYICKAALKNICALSEKECPEAHFVSPYLWQVKVNDRWYNLDTVNNDVERVYKAAEPDYITTMPQEVPKMAGELITILYKRMVAVRTADDTQEAAALKVQSYPMRRLHCEENDSNVRRLKMTRRVTPVRPLTRPAVGNLHRTDATTVQQILGTVRHNVRKIPAQDDKASTTAQAIKGTQSKPEPTVTEQTPIAAIPRVEPVLPQTEADRSPYQWQVQIADNWKSLTSANKEIEVAYQDKAPEYITAILPEEENDTAQAQLLSIDFEQMTAVLLETNQVVAVRRFVSTPEARAATQILPDLQRHREPREAAPNAQGLVEAMQPTQPPPDAGLLEVGELTFALPDPQEPTPAPTNAQGHLEVREPSPTPPDAQGLLEVMTPTHHFDLIPPEVNFQPNLAQETDLAESDVDEGTQQETFLSLLDPEPVDSEAKSLELRQGDSQRPLSLHTGSEANQEILDKHRGISQNSDNNDDLDLVKKVEQERDIRTGDNDGHDSNDTDSDYVDCYDGVDDKDGDESSDKSQNVGVADDEVRTSEQEEPVEEYEWLWSEDFQTYTAHEESFSRLLEAAYLSGRKTGVIKVNGEKILIDFNSMIETTKSDNKTRLIKRQRIHHPKEDQ